jgi:hypothetical protein
MNPLYPTWALGGLAAASSGPAFTTSPGPGSPGGTPGPSATTSPSPSQTQPVSFWPPFSEPWWPDFYYPYRSYYPYRPYNPVRAAVGAAQARRLLDLAERASRILDDTLRRADEKDASTRDRDAADEVRACRDSLTKAAGSFSGILAELRAAVDSDRAADLGLDQVRALETFAECADRADRRRRGE